jgi:CheY-like chemotaxis protein
MMNGTIWVKSEPGVGSVFHFTARFGLSVNAILGESPKLPADLVGLPVLVVDDNATNRHILSRVLENWHMVPVVVDSGQAAIKAMETAAKTGGSFALILLDCQMPQMSGFDLVEHLKSHPGMSSAPIVMLTSSASVRGDEERCRQLGIAAYLSKPVKQSDLMAAIIKVLGNNASKVAQVKLVNAPKPAEKLLGQANVLLVEDNHVNAWLMRHFLEKHGHKFRLVNNGREAVAAHLAEWFDLILMDVQMPEMDGLTATRIIRENEKKTGRHVMDAYLSKPIRPDELETAIAHLLNGGLSGGQQPVGDRAVVGRPGAAMSAPESPDTLAKAKPSGAPLS